MGDISRNRAPRVSLRSRWRQLRPSSSLGSRTIPVAPSVPENGLQTTDGGPLRAVEWMALVLAANIANTLRVGRRAARTCSAAGSRLEVLAP